MRGLWQCYKSAGDVLLYMNRQFGTIYPIEDVIIIVISQTLTVGLKFRQKCLLQTVMQKEDFYPHFSPGWKYINCKYSINTVILNFTYCKKDRNVVIFSMHSINR